MEDLGGLKTATTGTVTVMDQNEHSPQFKSLLNCKDCGKLDMEFDREKMSMEAVNELKQIDKSTTYFGLHIVTENCLMERFAKSYHHSYQPTDGFGYYELAKSVDMLDPPWEVILMDEVL